ncbi:MAG: hypothetical protein AAGF97_03800 [Planctomycetota bacterium]
MSSAGAGGTDSSAAGASLGTSDGLSITLPSITVPASGTIIAPPQPDEPQADEPQLDWQLLQHWVRQQTRRQRRGRQRYEQQDVWQHEL